MPFLNRLPISHMILTLKYISQELISELQFRNGFPISHMMMILKCISQELISKLQFRIGLFISHDTDVEIFFARIVLKISIL